MNLEFVLGGVLAAALLVLILLALLRPERLKSFARSRAISFPAKLALTR